MQDQKVKRTLAFDSNVYAAMRELAHDRRRSFTAETHVALDEHLRAAGRNTTNERK